MNVTLIGMPGAGKSHIGKILAERLGYQLLEIDALIEKEYGMPLQKIVEKLGAETFLDIEAARIIVNCKSAVHAVISPGGSAVYRDSAMEFLKENSKIVYLRANLDVLERRIGSIPRGIVNPGNMPFEELFSERRSLYEKWADLEVEADDEAERIASKIMSELSISGLA